MHIEDLIILLAQRVQMNSYDSKIVNSFYEQILLGRGLTEKQANLAIKILGRQISKINQLAGKDLSIHLQNPSFRLGKRVVSNLKKISITDVSDFGKCIKVEFPFDEKLLTTIRNERTKLNQAAWDAKEKAWFFSLDERSIEFLSTFVEQNGFSVDDEFNNYLTQAKKIKEEFEQYVPMLVSEGNSLFFKNVPKNVPQPENNNVLSALFLARRVGINTWDEVIEEKFKNNEIDVVVKSFLETVPKEHFEFYLDDHPILASKDIIKHLLPSIFIIPGGSELEKLQLSLELVDNIGIDRSKVSVLFRLPKETGENFNNFVKNQGLNNPVNGQSQIVFISSKVPKTIIEPKIKFNSVVNFGTYSVHYTIREFLKNHHNIVHILDKKSQRRLNFGVL